MMERCEVPVEAALRTDNQQARSRVGKGVVGMKVADQVLDFLVRDDTADKENVGPVVVEVPGHQPVRGAIEMREVRDDRQHRSARKPEGFEVLTVEFGIAERQIATLRVSLELAPAAKTL